MLSPVARRVVCILLLLCHSCDCFQLANSKKRGDKLQLAKTREPRPDITSYLDGVDNVAAPRSPKRRKSSNIMAVKKDNSDECRTNKSPSLQVQLCYARNGHTCTRQVVSRELLHDIKRKLHPLMESREIEAWRQKVEVAADVDQLSTNSAARAKRIAASCESVAQCQAQLQRLLQQDAVDVPFLQFFNTWRTVPPVMDLARFLAPTARTLMFGDSHHKIRLYQDAVFWKRSGDGPTPWHADAPMAPFDTPHIITAWIPLTTTSVAGLDFCSQSHADMALHYWKKKNNNTEQDEDLSTRYAAMLPSVRYGPLQMGDVTWHAGWTLHSADAAQSDRIALAITYVSAFAPVRESAESTGDREDAQSYQDWIQQVPRGTGNWDHPLAPILLG